MLSSAAELDARQKAIARRTLLAAREARFGSLPGLVDAVAAGQQAAAFTALAAVPRMLTEQGINNLADAGTRVRSLSYVASDGRSLDGLMDYTRKAGVNRLEFDRIVLTQMSDTARSASLLGSAVQPAVTGYVRMLEGNSCSRCVVLAGRFYRKSAGFQRHPRCDCRHIPSAENLADDLRTDPNAYFQSLSAAEQDRAFTTAGAEAIRNGADIGKVVNARRGMTTAQTLTGRRRLVGQDAFGRPLYTTTASATKGTVRLMPESIIQLAGSNRAEMLRLLQSHGYVTQAARRVATATVKAAAPKIDAEVFARAFSGGPSDVDALRRAYQDEANKAFNARGYRAESEAYTTDYDPIARAKSDSPLIVIKTVVKDAAGDEAGDLYRTFRRLPGDEGISARHDFFSLREVHQGKGLASDLGPVMEDWYRSVGVRHIDLEANIDVGGYTWAKKGYDWSPGPDVAGRGRIAARLVDEAEFESDEVRALAQKYAGAFDGPRSEWPAPYDVAMLGWEEGATEWFGKLLMMDSKWQGRKVL